MTYNYQIMEWIGLYNNLKNSGSKVNYMTKKDLKVMIEKLLTVVEVTEDVTRRIKETLNKNFRKLLSSSMSYDDLQDIKSILESEYIFVNDLRDQYKKSKEGHEKLISKILDVQAAIEEITEGNCNIMTDLQKDNLKHYKLHALKIVLEAKTEELKKLQSEKYQGYIEPEEVEKVNDDIQSINFIEAAARKDQDILNEDDIF